MRLIMLVSLVLISLNCFASSSPYPKMLASIRPLQSIVANITEGVDDIGLIVEDGVSIHSYAMKPEDAKKINRSNLIILIDRNLETFLTNSVINNKNVRYIEAARLPGVKLISAGEHNCTHNHDHDHEHEDEADEHEEDEHDHEHEEHQAHNDYHIWFDIENVKAISIGLADYFSKENPENASRYKANLDKFLMTIEKLDKETMHALSNAPKNNYNYLVTHNAYQYYINRYNLKEPKSITFDHGANIGAKEFLEIKNMINQDQVSCIIEEPNHPSAVLEKLKKESNVKAFYYDPEIGEGKNTNNVIDHYLKMMNELKNVFYGCLS